jgi:hypothetical protein
MFPDQFGGEPGELVITGQVAFFNSMEERSGWWASKTRMDKLNEFRVTARILV